MNLEKYHQPAFLARKNTREKLTEHEHLYSLAKSLHQKYCKITHSFHTLPDYLIIGTPRSASTSLYQYLIQHPAVSPALTKQLHFFDTFFYKGIEWYKVCFPYQWKKIYQEKILRTKFVTGEATVHYILHPLAPQRIFETFPKIKLVIILRNPVDRAYSHWNMEFQNKNDELSFEDAINAEESRLKGEFDKLSKDENYTSDNYPHRAYLATGLYAEQLKRWFNFFPKEQFLIIKSEEFSDNPSQQFNEVLKFLNIPKFDLPEYKKLHSRNYKEMNPETRKKLIEYYKPHNEKLYTLIGQNFNWDEISNT